MYTFLFYICLILGLLLILVAAVSTLFTFLVVHGYNKHKSEIDGKVGNVGAELLSDLVPIIKLVIWIPFVKSAIAREIEKGLEKYIKKMLIRQIIDDIVYITVAIMFFSLAGSTYNMNMTWNSIPSLLQTIFKEEEPEPEVIEEEGWSWDSIPDNYNNGGFINGGSGEADREIDTLSYGLSADESTIIVEGLQHVYKIAYISDLHMMQPDETEINSEWYTSHGTTFTDRNNGFNNSYEILPRIIDCLNGNSFDAVVFGGDIMDNYSDQNFEYLQEQFNKITKSNTVFIVADHDYLTEMTTNGSPNYAADNLGISGSVKSVNIGYDNDNLVLVAQNHSNGPISSGDLDKVRTALENATNSLFFTHVPIASLTKASEMEEWSKSVHNDQVYYWSENASNSGYRPSGSQSELMQELYNSESLKGVFAGHVHSSYDTELSDGKTEHIFEASFRNSIGVITVKSSNAGTGNMSGNASGDYAIGLDDGTYYWYHQSGGRGKCSCVYCGNWSNASWGNNDCFGSNGCAVYSLAIGYSNLTGQEMKPTDILSILGCKLTDNGGVLNIDTSVSSAFSGIGIIRGTAVATLANATGTSYSTVEKNTASIDEVLSRGGYVWGSWIDSKCQWCGNGSQHFMMIRKQFGDNYYCFTSCRGKCASTGGKEGAIQTMNYALNKQECINAMSTGTLYGIWGTNSSGGSGGNSGGSIDIGNITSSEVYRVLSQNPTYSGKSAALALAYEEAAPLYGSDFAVGLMANIVAEGSSGVVEYSFSQAKAWGFSLPSGGTKVASMEDVYYLIDWDSTSKEKGSYGVKKGSCGLGMIQWSFGRRVGLAQLYKEKASTFSDAELGVIEVEYMMQELGSSYSSVPSSCATLTAAECAAKICKTYEKPANTNAQAIIRSATAEDLSRVLSGVN